MITRQDLDTYRYHECEMEQRMAKLKKYQNHIKRLEVSYGHLYKSISEYTNIRQSIDKLISSTLEDIKYISERNSEVERLIGSIPDPKIKAVMYQYYVLCDTWEDTAAILGMSVRNVHRLHGFGLEIIKRLQS